MPDCAVRADQHLALENVGPCWNVISTRQSGRHSFTTFETIFRLPETELGRIFRAEV